MASHEQSGFSIPYAVRGTPDKGRGVFATAPIRKGTIVWRFVRGQYGVFDEASFREYLAPKSRSEVIYELEHMFGAPEFPGYVIRIHDDGVLLNHSREPNIAVNGSEDDQIPYDTSPRSAREVADALLSDRFALIAIRGLEVGDELTLDYNIGVEDPPYYAALYEEYGLTSPWL